MADPKMLTAKELLEAKEIGERMDSPTVRRLLYHIAALEAALSAAHAAVRAGDAVAEAVSGDEVVCLTCSQEPDVDADAIEHLPACPIPAWRTARAAVKLEGEP